MTAALPPPPGGTGRVPRCGQGIRPAHCNNTVTAVTLRCVRRVSLCVKLPLIIFGAAVAAAALTACSTSSSSQPATASQAATAIATVSAPAAPPSAAAKAIDGNITIAPAGSMTPGPVKITPVYCGKFTAAQQSKYGTTAAGGLVYKFANDSSTLVAAPKLSVNFTTGTTVAGSNVTGSLTQVSPGQASTGEVDALDDSGGNLSFTGCQVMSYAVVTSSGVDPVSYAG